MDPISIATASVTLVKLCADIYMLISKTEPVDTTIRILATEIDSLMHVLLAMGESFNDPALVALSSQTGHEGQHWRNIQQSLGDCRKTLEGLERILGSINKSEGGFLRRPRKLINLTLNSGDIALLKQQVASCRQTMQLSLQLIAVYELRFVRTECLVLPH